ncbi:MULTISPECIES: glycoside hydrolase family 19 protein [Pseudomonas]|uniref:Glycoside hydrolase family 19 n=1 Tax=Pseudomonas citronellolis TaxID=53408 RepID=A0A1A9K6C5_9PSED|nr:MULTISPECIES: glycoside hydrolase family 19 protein [Pseudomonas]ANI13102.1 glycoside hydrolase family 19 [Pseudomonas citronellolis]GLU37124.1 hypothetical protein Pssp01_12170 [Pseudomonas sp. NBRC 100443]
MEITDQQLLLLFPRAGQVLPWLAPAMRAHGVDRAPRAAAFLAQVGHESAGLTRLVENLAYGAQGLADTWPRRFRNAAGKPTALACRLAYQPQAIANCAYAGRNGNGDEASGDGWRYRGRGLLQITGRANYRRVGMALGQAFEAHPESLAEPRWACESAAWWWADAGLNELADAGRFEDITRRINGGLNGLAERQKLWRRAQEVLG